MEGSWHHTNLMGIVFDWYWTSSSPSVRNIGAVLVVVSLLSYVIVRDLFHGMICESGATEIWWELFLSVIPLALIRSPPWRSAVLNTGNQGSPLPRTKNLYNSTVI